MSQQQNQSRGAEPNAHAPRDTHKKPPVLTWTAMPALSELQQYKQRSARAGSRKLIFRPLSDSPPPP